MTSQQITDVQKLYRQPEHTLSAKDSKLDLELNVIYPCSSIGIVTSLSNGIEVPQGTVLVHGWVEGENGIVETFDLVAGRDTAEWAIRFPSIQEIVKHHVPQAYRAWTVQQPGETVTVAQNYTKQIDFRFPFVPTKFSLEFLSSSDIPSNLAIDVDRIIFYTVQEIERLKPGYQSQ